jgi:hypothetical protein
MANWRQNWPTGPVFLGNKKEDKSMYWLSKSVNGFGFSEMECSVCEEIQTGGDIIYRPQFTSDENDDERAKQIRLIFGADPFIDFQICENCMAGHCGVVKGKTANTWLSRYVEKYEKLMKLSKKPRAFRLKKLGGMDVIVIGKGKKKIRRD